MKKIAFVAGLLGILATSAFWADSRDERLMQAVREQDMSSLKYYLENAGANSSYVNDSGRSVLMEACSKQWLPGVEKLIEAQANPSFKNSSGQNALMITVKETSHDSIAKYLIEKAQANVNDTDDNGKTVLMYAAENDSYNNLVYLVKNTRVNVGATDNHGNTALMYAVKSGKTDAAKFLAGQTGINWDEENSDGKNIFMLAIESKNTQMVRFLLQGNYGLDIDKKIHGMPILFWAIKTRQSKDIIGLIMDTYTPEALLSTTDENGNDIEYYIDMREDKYARSRFEKIKRFHEEQEAKKRKR